jgi:hypothetical protein
MARNNVDQTSGWVGWVYFAGFLMMVVGVLQMISGFTALLNDTYFVTRNLLVFEYETWGWGQMLLGLIVLMAGTATISGQVWGRTVGVVMAMLGIVTHFAFVASYPVWSIIAMVIDVLIIYALTVHGGEARVE